MARRGVRAAALATSIALVAAAVVGGTAWATMRTRQLRAELGETPSRGRRRAGRAHRGRRRARDHPCPPPRDGAGPAARSSRGSTSSTRGSRPRSPRSGPAAPRWRSSPRSSARRPTRWPSCGPASTAWNGRWPRRSDDQFRAAVLLLRSVEQPCRTALARSPASSGYALVDANFPDPFVVAHDGEYFAYATNGGGGSVQMARGPSLAELRLVGPALDQLPSWGAPNRTWAPSVLPRFGYWVMYYSVRTVAPAARASRWRWPSVRPGPSSTARPPRSSASRAGPSTRRRSSTPTAHRG